MESGLTAHVWELRDLGLERLLEGSCLIVLRHKKYAHLRVSQVKNLI